MIILKIITSFIDFIFGCLCLGGIRALAIKESDQVPMRILCVCAAVFFVNAVELWI